MNLEDAVSVPFIQGFARNPGPDKIVWRQVNATRSRFYWLAVDAMNPRTIAVIARTLAESGDSSMTFYGEVAVALR